MKEFKNTSILITGGTGSFGREFVDFLIKKKYPFDRIIIFSRDEFKQDEMQQELIRKKNKNLRFFLGDIRDKDRLNYALRDVDSVVHAAALKQVPASEYNPIEFIKTNVIGAQNIIEAALNSKVKKVIALSTDKAVAPVNLYGATKLCSDKLFVSANNISGKSGKAFSIVRYGNVLGSRGSILPQFFEEIKLKSNIFKITDTKMTRFNILMENAIDMVVWSLKHSNGGEILVPKLKSIKVIDLARAINPNYELKIIGIRPGEKIHEELIASADGYQTYDLGKYYSIIPHNLFLKIKDQSKYKKINYPFSYNSENNNFLSIKQIQNIVSKNFNKL
jgi:UDP-N-acetylglucosamine 4,6-dehydratase (inverting)